ncbi:STAS domain-containing protein [Georgenia alba]|uniref:STAS domain-containing protein n=1 Tax=Georgenia alba TaxID=2233858 RepID=A0ABW2QBN7_9MICO
MASTPEGGETGSVAVLFSPARTRLVLSGELDDAVEQELTTAVLECRAAAAPVDVDVRTVAFIDSTGAAHLAQLAQSLPVRVIQPPDSVRFLLTVTGLAAQVEILEDCPAFPE